MTLNNVEVKVIFYLVGKKGYEVLVEFIKKNGKDSILSVIISKDLGVQNDYYKEIDKLCEKEKIKVFDRKNYKENENNKNTYRFAIGWRWIIEKVENLIILHDSPLPKYRGFSPVVNMLINREEVLGVTAIIANSEYDKGDIIAQRKIKINYPIKIKEAIELLIKLYIIIILDLYEKLKKQKLKRKKQIEQEASYSVWRDDKDYFIDWKNDSKYICRFIDSVGFPYKGAISSVDGEFYRIEEAIDYPDVKNIYYKDVRKDKAEEDLVNTQTEVKKHIVKEEEETERLAKEENKVAANKLIQSGLPQCKSNDPYSCKI